MKYVIEGAVINGEELYVDTVELKDNLGVITYEIGVDGKKESFDVTIYDKIDSKNKCDIVAQIKNDNLKIDHECKIEEKDLFEAIFKAVENVTSIKKSKEVKDILSPAIVEAIQKDNGDKIMEILYKEACVLVDDNGLECAVIDGFRVMEDGKVELINVDYLDFCESPTIMRYASNKLFKIMLESSDNYCNNSISKIETIDSEDSSIKNKSNFDTEEDYSSYKRELLMNAKGSMTVDNTMFDDLF